MDGMDFRKAQMGCVAYQDGYSTSYEYVPSKAAGIAFVTIFGISTILHTGQTIWSRQWWTILFAIGGLTELIGWAGRLWSAICPYNNNAYMIQITTLIIAPTFWTAALYIILGRLITICGRYTSPLSPRAYLYIFCTADIISLVLQAVGGGMASSASGGSGGNTAPGTRTMVAGILFQMAAITVFCGLFVIFIQRIGKQGGLPPRFKLLVATTAVSIFFIYVRSFYRAVELLQGWTGYLITHEVYFIVLDGAMMVVAVVVFNVIHPAWFLKEPVKRKEAEADSIPLSTARTMERYLRVVE